MKKDKGDWYWNERRGGYVLEAFDHLFKRGEGSLRFHHYKAAIVISGGHGVWLYEEKDFDALIQLIQKARKACLRGPMIKKASTPTSAFKQLAARKAKAKAKAKKKR